MPRYVFWNCSFSLFFSLFSTLRLLSDLLAGSLPLSFQRSAARWVAIVLAGGMFCSLHFSPWNVRHLYSGNTTNVPNVCRCIWAEASWSKFVLLALMAIICECYCAMFPRKWKESTKVTPLQNQHDNEKNNHFSGWWFHKHVLFSPLPGEMIQLDEHIFQMGWFNHQQVLRLFPDISPLKTGDDFQLVIVIWVLRGVIYI